ncbi:hypothetical protein M569_09777, partial [Genlisea aurea]
LYPGVAAFRHFMDQGIEYKLTAAESPDSSPVVAATVGRVMTTLLMAKVSKLQTAISLSTTTLPKVAPLGGMVIEFANS